MPTAVRFYLLSFDPALPRQSTVPPASRTAPPNTPTVSLPNRSALQATNLTIRSVVRWFAGYAIHFDDDEKYYGTP